MGAGVKETLLMKDYENIYNAFKQISSKPGLAELIKANNTTVQKYAPSFQNYLLSEIKNYSEKGIFKNNNTAIEIYKSLGGFLLSENTDAKINPQDTVNNYLTKFNMKIVDNSNIDTAINKKRSLSFREAFY